MSLPALQPPCPSADSSARILKEASGVEPGWVEIMPRKRVTDHVRTWLLSAQTAGGGGGAGDGRSGRQCPPRCPTFPNPRMTPVEGVRIWAPLDSSLPENLLFPRTPQNSCWFCL